MKTIFKALDSLLCLALLATCFAGSAQASTQEPPPPASSELETIALPPQSLSLPADFAQTLIARDAGDPKLDSTMNGLVVAAQASVEEAMELAHAQQLRLSGKRVQVQLVVRDRTCGYDIPKDGTWTASAP